MQAAAKTKLASKPPSTAKLRLQSIVDPLKESSPGVFIMQGLRIQPAIRASRKGNQASSRISAMTPLKIMALR